MITQAVKEKYARTERRRISARGAETIHLKHLGGQGPRAFGCSVVEDEIFKALLTILRISVE